MKPTTRFALICAAFAVFSSVFAFGQLNVLMIAVDDMKPLLGCYGDTQALTPSIDRLADDGVVFLNAHCQWSVCGPSRASLTTSLMPEETGVTGFKNLRYILPDLITLPQHFKNNGYETVGVGKIHDYRTVGDENPADPGGKTLNGSTIDDVLSWSIPYINGGSGIGSTTAYSDDLGKNLKRGAESVEDVDSAFTDGKICDNGLAQLNFLSDQLDSTGKPFFLGVGFKKPHLPFLAPETYWDMYDREDFEVHPFQFAPLNFGIKTIGNITELRNTYYMELDGNGKAVTIPTIIPEDQQKELIHGYYACASFIDAQVGRLLDELESLGRMDDTIIVLWGDHGFHLGDHNKWAKHTNLEQASRSPLIISSPNISTKGRKTMSPASLLDVYPTLCELAGLSIPEQPTSDTVLTGRPLKGKSLVPVLQDPNDSVRFGAVNHYGSPTNGYAYRTERYRYIEWIKTNGDILEYQLYDYKFDPYETVNLAVYPEYFPLVHQLSNSLRNPEECQGCERLDISSANVVDASSVGLAFVQEEFNSTGVTHNTGRDTSDAFFGALVDFDAFDGSVSTFPQIVFEIGGGGGGDGLSVVYVTGNELALSIRGEYAVGGSVSYVLTNEQISAGMLEVAVVVDIDYDGGSDDLVKLFVDRELVGWAMLSIAGNDFVNSDKSGFGMRGGSATGGWQSAGDDVAVFTSGKINYDAGLWYSDNIVDVETDWCEMANLDYVYPVDISDLAMLLLNWLEVPAAGLTGDLKKDGHVNALDFSVMSGCWLMDRTY